MTNAEINAALRDLVQLMITQDHVVTNHMVAQANLGVGAQHNSCTPASRMGDFIRMNPPTLHVTEVDEKQQGLIDEVFKVEDATGVTPREKVETETYQLKDVANGEIRDP